MPQSRILITHVKSDRLSRPFVLSAVGHAVLFLGATFVTDLFPPVEIVSGSTGVGGGQGGNLVSVGLAADLGGGAGMYKPAVTPRVQAAPPPPTKRKQEVTPKPAPDQVEFQQKTSRKLRPRPKKKAAVPSRAGSKDSQSNAKAQVPRKADAGSGGTGGAPSGSGGGFGGGQGVRVGSGTGQEGLHSWYARQVEQRVGQNCSGLRWVGWQDPWKRSSASRCCETAGSIGSNWSRPAGFEPLIWPLNAPSAPAAIARSSTGVAKPKSAICDLLPISPTVKSRDCIMSPAISSLATVLILTLVAPTGMAQPSDVKIYPKARESTRLAVADFVARTAVTPQTRTAAKVFNDVLWTDLKFSAFFEMPSKSFYPLKPLRSPQDVSFDHWQAPTLDVDFLAFGNVHVDAAGAMIEGYLYDVKTRQQVLGKRYSVADVTLIRRVPTSWRTRSSTSCRPAPARAWPARRSPTAR